VADFVDALVQREHRAKGEQDQRHHEGVEVAAATEAEGVQPVRRALGLLLAQQQQALIRGVGHRVHRLREATAIPAFAASAATIALLPPSADIQLTP